MLFGRSSEKRRPSPGVRDGAENQLRGEPGGGEPGKRGQRRGSKGHGRRDYSHLDTREEVHDMPEAERACSACTPHVREGCFDQPVS
ncbi:hypothetical protein [Parafrankia sp. FMc2]|uniref:hypothetical protein n=1 Tax=Parafrankia sp. FMc2 TaxID=3233196 RepID=UPI0034D63C05